MVAYWPVVIAVLGVLMWWLTPKAIPKWQEIPREMGRWFFIIGTFWTVYTLIGHTVPLFR